MLFFVKNARTEVEENLLLPEINNTNRDDSSPHNGKICWISEIDEFVRIDVKYLKTSNISAYKWKFCHLFLFINIFSR